MTVTRRRGTYLGEATLLNERRTTNEHGFRSRSNINRFATIAHSKMASSSLTSGRGQMAAKLSERECDSGIAVASNFGERDSRQGWH